MTIEEKLMLLEKLLLSHDSLGIAFSGGVDSTFLLAFASSLRSEKFRVTALTVKAANFAPDEIEYTQAFCREHDIPHLLIDMDFEAIDGFKENTKDRCYFCKKSIFTKVKEISSIQGIHAIADGTNLDDDMDYRPGKKALQELEVISPLKESGLTKSEIRQALKELNIDIWNKPAFACLASRIPYGEEITEEKLEAIYMVEKTLRELGFSQVRVRHHGEVARIEVLPLEFGRLLEESTREIIQASGVQAGFSFIALDLGGYKMGNMNQL